MNQQKIIKTGNSLALTLPARLVKALGLKAGDRATISVSTDQIEITYRFHEVRQLSLTANINSKP